MKYAIIAVYKSKKIANNPLRDLRLTNRHNMYQKITIVEMNRTQSPLP